MASIERVEFKYLFPGIDGDLNLVDSLDDAQLMAASAGIYGNVDFSKLNYWCDLSTGEDEFPKEDANDIFKWKKAWSIVFVPVIRQEFLEVLFDYFFTHKKFSRRRVSNILTKMFSSQYEQYAEHISEKRNDAIRELMFSGEHGDVDISIASATPYLVLDGLMERYPDGVDTSDEDDDFIFFYVDL